MFHCHHHYIPWYFETSKKASCPNKRIQNALVGLNKQAGFLSAVSLL